MHEEALAIAAEFIKPFEGFRSAPYLCPAGVPTIGYGTICYPNGRRVTMKDIAVSESQASFYITDHLRRVSLPGVISACPKVTEPHKVAALLSFAHNLGVAALASSTLARMINADATDALVSEQFRRWNKAGGKVLNGLIRRREGEVALWCRRS